LEHLNTTLTERERQVLEAVIETFVDTAEPAGSRTIAKKFGMALSAATIRNIMSDLEEKGLLYHPHTSAGRIPTDQAYRLYVDALMGRRAVTPDEADQLRHELAGERNALDQLLVRAAQVLGVLANELGVAASPSLEEAVLERLELVRVSADRLLLVLALRSGVVRTIFVEVPAHMAADAVARVAVVLNERLAGLRLREIRAGLRERLRDAGHDAAATQLLNIFVEEADGLLDASAGEVVPGGVVLGSTGPLTGQPEFATKEGLQGLISLTERRDVLRQALARRQSPGLTITIGNEHGDPKLAQFTLVTSTYRLGPLAGVIGVMGPTRMPYQKIVALVEHTSRLVGELVE
jgi:heat-inducible transcriptional repressor